MHTPKKDAFFVKAKRPCLKHRCRLDTCRSQNIDIGLIFETRRVFFFRKCLLLRIEVPVLVTAMDYFFNTLLI